MYVRSDSNCADAPCRDSGEDSAGAKCGAGEGRAQSSAVEVGHFVAVPQKASLAPLHPIIAHHH